MKAYKSVNAGSGVKKIGLVTPVGMGAGVEVDVGVAEGVSVTVDVELNGIEVGVG